MLTLQNVQKHEYRTVLDGGGFLVTRIAYDGNGNAEYVGQAIPGSAEGDGVWLIKKISYDGNQNPTATAFAGGQALFDKSWTDRLSHTYA